MRKIIQNFVHTHMEELRRVAFGGEQSLGEFQKSIREAVQFALDELARRCIDSVGAEIFRYDCCPQDHTSCCSTQF
jgi:hypothetical protein